MHECKAPATHAFFQKLFQNLIRTSRTVPVVQRLKVPLVGPRRWQQNLVRAQEIHASLPDPSLLLRGIDGATAS